MHAFLPVVVSALVAGVVGPSFVVEPAAVSDPTAVFALIDKAVLRPSAEAPTEIELHGAFALAEGNRGAYYRSPRVGVLRFAMGPQREATLAQWRDLGKVAGTGSVLAFGSRYEMLRDPKVPVRVRGAQETTPEGELPVFPAGFGAQIADSVDFGVVAELKHLPRCLPVDLGGEKPPADWPARDVVFTCTNCLATSPDLRYVFAVETSDGDRCASTAILPGKGVTSWTVPLSLQVGETVTWSVHVVGARGERTSVDTSTFVVPAKGGADRR